MNKETTCCFTGPRTHKLPLLQGLAVTCIDPALALQA